MNALACLPPGAPTQENKKYSLGTGDGFPTQRRPIQREMSTDSNDIVNEWFASSGITIGIMADTNERIEKAKRLVYTWRDCFATSLKDIKATDLIEHSIELEPNAKPVKGTLPKYTPREREFASTIFPDMEDAGIIVRRSSPWGARTKFPPKKKGSELMRVVHNFMPVNHWTIKSGYPMHHLEEVINILLRPKYRVYFYSDAANGYWAIKTKLEDQNKTGFLAPNGQWVYLRMGQGLKGAPFTYAQFTDLVFGPLPANSDGVLRSKSLIGDHNNHAFSVFMDDHGASAEDFDSLFTFLHTQYFPRCVFGPVYLSGPKTHLFEDSIELLGFRGGADGLRPSEKHMSKIRDWPTPTNRAELDAFLWLTPFLRIFIPGRADHVMEMKKAYLKQIPAEPKQKPAHDDEMEDCDRDVAKPVKAKRPTKPTIQKKWIEKETFDWGLNQQESFDQVKEAICNNAMSGADPNVQYHLTADASEQAVGGVLFQLHGCPEGTQAKPKLLPNERIIMFLSFKLQDAETRYGNSERECLAIVKCLSEVRWLVMGSRHPVFIYSDHESLKPIFAKGQTEKPRIATWLDRLGEFDWQLMHRPSRDQHIGIADGLSRMPTRLTETSSREISDRMTMCVTESKANEANRVEQWTYPLRILEKEGLEKYQRSPMYAQIMEYLMGGEDYLRKQKVFRNRAKQLRHKAKQYRLPHHTSSRHLRWVEDTGAQSICIIEEEVPRVLQSAHEDHGHFASALTLDFLIGQFYWPTRTRDIIQWCQSCDACQKRLRKPIKAIPLTIQWFEPMAMLGVDWLGPITPSCTATGSKYVIVVVDYFSRFTWAGAYQDHTALETIHMFRDVIAPIFGWMRNLYSDNGSHFVNHDFDSLLIQHGVSHYTGPISHPSSTGLLERAVQEMLALISKKCIERGTTNSWGLFIRDNVLDVNTKGTTIHGYTPAKLMLGFDPKHFHFDTNAEATPNIHGASNEQLPAHEYNLLAALRSENKLLANEAASYHEAYHKKQNRKQRLPKPGDLVLIWNHSKATQHARKLEEKWLGPRMLVSWTNHGRSGWVREIHGSAKTRRYHINDIILYHERKQQPPPPPIMALLQHDSRGSTPIVQSSRRMLSRAGQRALFLPSLFSN